MTGTDTPEPRAHAGWKSATILARVAAHGHLASGVRLDPDHPGASTLFAVRGILAGLQADLASIGKTEFPGPDARRQAATAAIERARSNLDAAAKLSAGLVDHVRGLRDKLHAKVMEVEASFSPVALRRAEIQARSLNKQGPRAIEEALQVAVARRDAAPAIAASLCDGYHYAAQKALAQIADADLAAEVAAVAPSADIVASAVQGAVIGVEELANVDAPWSVRLSGNDLLKIHHGGLVDQLTSMRNQANKATAPAAAPTNGKA